jgi:hypothetical protein
VIGAVLRIYSYFYVAALALLLLGLAMVSIGSNTHLKLGMLPWEHRALTHWLLGAGVLGLVSAVLASMGKARILFLAYCLAVFGLMFRGYFLTSYPFGGKSEFRFVIWLTAGALLAILGAWSSLRRKKSRKRR